MLTIIKKIRSHLNRPSFIEPRFLIIGCQKCGTTSLYNYLIQHPHVSAATKKEIHFFDSNYHKGYAWYKRHFPEPKSKKKSLITGEATPYYILHPHAPARVKATLPDTKLILMLRDPVERAFSHYKHHVKFKVEPLAFDEAIKAESERLDGEWDKMIRDQSYNSYNIQMYSYLTRGVYVTQLERWLAHFPREQVLLLQSEEFFTNPEKAYLETLHFLGLPDHQLDTYQKFNPGKNESISPAARRYLIDYFKPYNERLFRLIRKDFSWQA